MDQKQGRGILKHDTVVWQTASGDWNGGYVCFIEDKVAVVRTIYDTFQVSADELYLLTTPAALTRQSELIKSLEKELEATKEKLREATRSPVPDPPYVREVPFATEYYHNINITKGGSDHE